MATRRRTVRAGFAACAVLAVIGLFVLDGAAAGAVLFVTLLLFIVSCILALSRETEGARTGAERTGLTGWFGRWL